MIVEVYLCAGCGQVRLRLVTGTALIPLIVDRRAMVCGGEGLERANGGQTHDWMQMQQAGFFRLDAAVPA